MVEFDFENLNMSVIKLDQGCKTTSLVYHILGSETSFLSIKIQVIQP